MSTEHLTVLFCACETLQAHHEDARHQPGINPDNANESAAGNRSLIAPVAAIERVSNIIQETMQSLHLGVFTAAMAQNDNPGKSYWIINYCNANRSMWLQSAFFNKSIAVVQTLLVYFRAWHKGMKQKWTVFSIRQLRQSRNLGRPACQLLNRLFTPPILLHSSLIRIHPLKSWPGAMGCWSGSLTMWRKKSATQSHL